jgi:hypothetical protein
VTVPNQRDPDLTQIVRDLRKGVDDVKRNSISRWGRIPHLTVDPTSPPDGSEWIRDDLHELRYRANGTTGYTGANGSGAPSGTGAAGEFYSDTTNGRLYWSDGIGWIILQEPMQTSFAPVLSGGTWALGAGTSALKYNRHGGKITLHGLITFGAGMVAGAAILNVSTPVQIASDGFDVGTCRPTSTGVNNFGGITIAGSATTIAFQSPNAGASNSLSGFVAGFPFVWKSTDLITYEIELRMLSPYS